MRKAAAVALLWALLLSLAACAGGEQAFSSGSSQENGQPGATGDASRGGVSITVVTSYGADDGNRRSFGRSPNFWA